MEVLQLSVQMEEGDPSKVLQMLVQMIGDPYSDGRRRSILNIGLIIQVLSYRRFRKFCFGKCNYLEYDNIYVFLNFSLE